MGWSEDILQVKGAGGPLPGGGGQRSVLNTTSWNQQHQGDPKRIMCNLFTRATQSLHLDDLCWSGFLMSLQVEVETHEQMHCYVGEPEIWVAWWSLKCCKMSCWLYWILK